MKLLASKVFPVALLKIRRPVSLAAAEKAFPVLEGSREFDLHPLMKPVALATPVPEKARQAGIYPLAISMAMLLIPAAVYRKGRKR